MRSLRRPVQGACLVLFVALGVGASWKHASTFPFDTFQRLDPLLSLQAALADRAWIPALGAGLGLLGLTLLLGRFFCGWVCPLGTCLDLGDRWAFGRARRAWPNGEGRLRGIKYLLLLCILGAAALGQGLAFLLDPITWATRVVGLALWPLGTSAAAWVLTGSRPLLEQAGWMDLARAQVVPAPFGFVGWASLAFLAGATALERWQRRLWCRAFCPLGALLALPARFSLLRRRVDPDTCDRARPCAATCEMGCIGDDPTTFAPAECIQCLACRGACKPGATRFRFPSLPVPKAPPRETAPGPAVLAGPSSGLTRRQALGALGAGASTGAWLLLHPGQDEAAEECLRPPGALPETDFLATCVRCGLCTRVCPTGCLQPSLARAGVAGVFTPTAIMRVGPCDPNCTACGHVCPTGALNRLEVTDKPFARIGVAVLDRERCVAWEQGRACLVCDENCPWGAIRWEPLPGGEQRVPRVDANRCNGCGQCEKACPVAGESAIRVRGSGQIRLREGSYPHAGAQVGMVMVGRAEE